MRKETLTCILLSILLLPAGAEIFQQEYDVESSIDWSSGEFLLDIRIASPGHLTPGTRYGIEQIVHEDLPGIFLGEIERIVVNSRYTVGTAISQDPYLLDKLKRILPSGTKRAANYERDMAAIRVLYAFPLYGEHGLFGAFVTHLRPYPLRRVLGFVPEGNFTGIVIYAQGTYPLYGKSESGRLTQCLFPRIYDQNMEIVLEKERCDPQSLKRWGMVAYSTSLDLRSFNARIGTSPVYISARRLFGINNTDILIPGESADRLLASPKSRGLLEQGRIVVIVDPPEEGSQRRLY
jgi:hypothetical protein